MENQLKLKIRIGQVEFEAEGDTNAVTEQRDVFIQSIVPAASSFLDKIQCLEKARTVESPISNQIAQGDVTTPALPYSNTANNIDWSRTNLVTFLDDYGELTDRDFVLFAAYYNEQKNQDSNYVFSIESVKKYYNDGRRPSYSNNSQLLNMLAKAGLIIDAPNAENNLPKQYIISQKGYKYITNYEPKNKSDKKTKKTVVTKKKIDSVYSSLNADDLNLPNYPIVKNLKTSTEQLFLAMYIITAEKKGEWFKNSDIEYIMPNLFDVHVTKDSVSNAFRQKSWFDTKKAEDDAKSLTHRLLAQAQDFAEKIIAENKE